MDPSVRSSADGLPIRVVSELLGVPAPTLRSWELRYGIPTTSRSRGGHRRYMASELHELMLMRDGIARGARASQAALVVRGLVGDDSPAAERTRAFLQASDRSDARQLHDVLDRSREELGLAMTIDLVVMPAMRQVGVWWASGRCGVVQEHITTETVRAWLDRLTTLAEVEHDAPPVLLACGPLDQHTLGLEALGALLAEQGLGSRRMGARVSAKTLVAATAATGATEVVVVSHLRAQRRPAVEVLQALSDLGIATFFAGNAFSAPEQRRGVEGTYLGESLSAAATVLREHRTGAHGPRRPGRAA